MIRCSWSPYWRLVWSDLSEKMGRNAYILFSHFLPSVVSPYPFGSFPICTIIVVFLLRFQCSITYFQRRLEWFPTSIGRYSIFNLRIFFSCYTAVSFFPHNCIFTPPKINPTDSPVQSSTPYQEPHTLTYISMSSEDPPIPPWSHLRFSCWTVQREKSKEGEKE